MSVDLSIMSMVWLYALMLVPLAIFYYLRLGIIRETVIALFRMTVQLLLVATSGLLGLFSLGLTTRRATAAGALFTLWGTLTAIPMPIGGEQRILLDLGRWNFPLSSFFVGIASHAVLFVVGWTVSLVAGEPPADVDELIVGSRAS